MDARFDKLNKSLPNTYRRYGYQMIGIYKSLFNLSGGWWGHLKNTDPGIEEYHNLFYPEEYNDLYTVREGWTEADTDALVGTWTDEDLVMWGEYTDGRMQRTFNLPNQPLNGNLSRDLDQFSPLPIIRRDWQTTYTGGSDNCWAPPELRSWQIKMSNTRELPLGDPYTFDAYYNSGTDTFDVDTDAFGSANIQTDNGDFPTIKVFMSREVYGAYQDVRPLFELIGDMAWLDTYNGVYAYYTSGDGSYITGSKNNVPAGPLASYVTTHPEYIPRYIQNFSTINSLYSFYKVGLQWFVNGLPIISPDMPFVPGSFPDELPGDTEIFSLTAMMMEDIEVVKQVEKIPAYYSRYGDSATYNEVIRGVNNSMINAMSGTGGAVSNLNYSYQFRWGVVAGGAPKFEIHAEQLIALNNFTVDSDSLWYATGFRDQSGMPMPNASYYMDGSQTVGWANLLPASEGFSAGFGFGIAFHDVVIPVDSTFNDSGGLPNGHYITPYSSTTVDKTVDVQMRPVVKGFYGEGRTVSVFYFFTPDPPGGILFEPTVGGYHGLTFTSNISTTTVTEVKFYDKDGPVFGSKLTTTLGSSTTKKWVRTVDSVVPGGVNYTPWTLDEQTDTSTDESYTNDIDYNQNDFGGIVTQHTLINNTLDYQNISTPSSDYRTEDIQDLKVITENHPERYELSLPINYKATGVIDVENVIRTHSSLPHLSGSLKMLELRIYNLALDTVLETISLAGPPVVSTDSFERIQVGNNFTDVTVTERGTKYFELTTDPALIGDYRVYIEYIYGTDPPVYYEDLSPDVFINQTYSDEYTNIMPTSGWATGNTHSGTNMHPSKTPTYAASLDGVLENAFSGPLANTELHFMSRAIGDTFLELGETQYLCNFRIPVSVVSQRGNVVSVTAVEGQDFVSVTGTVPGPDELIVTYLEGDVSRLEIFIIPNTYVVDYDKPARIGNPGDLVFGSAVYGWFDTYGKFHRWSVLEDTIGVESGGGVKFTATILIGAWGSVDVDTKLPTYKPGERVIDKWRADVMPYEVTRSKDLLLFEGSDVDTVSLTNDRGSLTLTSGAAFIPFFATKTYRARINETTPETIQQVHDERGALSPVDPEDPVEWILDPSMLPSYPELQIIYHKIETQETQISEPIN